MNVRALHPPVDRGEGLSALERRLRQDLTRLNHPPADWVPPTYRDGERVLDVAVVGGGMCGLVAAFALIHGGMTNVRLFDRSPAGFEGPWVTYARMETLRSPKHLTGPAYGVASLTFRAWYEAQYGHDAWGDLDKIPRPTWMDYLRWYRDVLDLPVTNGVTVARVVPDDGLLRLDLDGPGAERRHVFARKAVMATGREGLGRANIPGFVATLPQNRWAHSSDAIDFAGLRGKRVVVVGIGASAVDNAAEALEAGAFEVRLLARRPAMPRINKLMGIGSFGFTAGFAALPDEWRWRYMRYSFTTQTPPPRGSTLRVGRHPNAHFHFGVGIEGAAMDGDEVVVRTADGGALRADHLILGTGFTVEPAARAEFGDAADKVLLWRDRYAPPLDEASEDLGNFPYLDPDFAFQEREPGAAPWLSRVYCFNYGAALSLGKVSGDIPGISDGAAWLARAIAASLYEEDVAAHWRMLNDYAKPELLGDEWTEEPLP